MRPPTGPVRLVLYGRSGCHLCEEARSLIEQVAEEVPLELVEVDIESDDRMHARFLERIPVVEHDGEIWFELEVDADRLIGLIDDAASMAPRDPGD